VVGSAADKELDQLRHKAGDFITHSSHHLESGAMYQTVPPYAGYPRRVKRLGEGVFIATLGVGLEALSLKEVIEHPEPTPYRMPGVYLGADASGSSGDRANIPSIYDVDVLRDKLLVGTRTNLEVVTASGRDLLAKFPVHALDVLAVKDYEWEDEEKSYTWDMAFSVGMGGLQVFRVVGADGASVFLRHISRIQFPGGTAQSVAVDAGLRLAFVSVVESTGAGKVYIVDISNPIEGVYLVDEDDDGLDDRILGTISGLTKEENPDLPFNAAPGALLLKRPYGYVADRANGRVHVFQYEKNQIGFVDDYPDWSGEDNEDSDNYFLRRMSAMDHKNLDIYYEILPASLEVDTVTLRVYEGDQDDTPILEIPGEMGGDEYKTGEGLHVTWDIPPQSLDDFPTPRTANITEGQYPGFWRIELEVQFPGDAPPFRTDIRDADPDEQGWQCPDDGLMVVDLVWRHRPKVFTTGGELGGFPCNINNFLSYCQDNYGNRPVKYWPIIYSEPSSYGDISGNLDKIYGWLDLFDDDINTLEPSDDVSQGMFNRGMTTNESDITLYHSDSEIFERDETIVGTNNIFLQFWMFEKFSKRCYLSFSTNEDIEYDSPNPYWHEGDVEFMQVALQLRDENLPCKKVYWLKPIAATASQHYWGQTLPWNPPKEIIKGGGFPGQDYIIKQGARPVIYIAEGSHATYFISQDMIKTSLFARLGTQIQYEIPKFSYDRTYPNELMDKYMLIPLEEEVPFDLFRGRWGATLPSPSSQSGPHGPPLRANHRPDGSGLIVRDHPVEFHNRCLKDGHEELLEIDH